jgi:pyruvate/2-oxoglutarate dehydrogenase complex dihydrolipoamide acyltransferase (E2) component
MCGEKFRSLSRFSWKVYRRVTESGISAWSSTATGPAGCTGNEPGRRHLHPIQRPGQRSGNAGQLWRTGALPAALAAVAVAPWPGAQQPRMARQDGDGNRRHRVSGTRTARRMALER